MREYFNTKTCRGIGRSRWTSLKEVKQPQTARVQNVQPLSWDEPTIVSTENTTCTPLISYTVNGIPAAGTRIVNWGIVCPMWQRLLF